jgi:Fe-S-cluster-containing dehydrogenase component
MINADECIGCKTCINSCPVIPHRPIWNHVTGKSIKCDLCTDTPITIKKAVYGSQACVEACVANALKVVNELPDQKDINGYDHNLQRPGSPCRILWAFLKPRQNKSKGKENYLTTPDTVERYY